MILLKAVAMADDNDRWIHAIPGSRELAWTIRTMGSSTKACPAMMLCSILMRTSPIRQQCKPPMKNCRGNAGQLRPSRTAVVSRSPVPHTPYTLVAAVCDGHPSEIGDAWGKKATQTIFAFFDLTWRRREPAPLARLPVRSFTTRAIFRRRRTCGGGGMSANESAINSSPKNSRAYCRQPFRRSRPRRPPVSSR